MTNKFETNVTGLMNLIYSKTIISGKGKYNDRTGRIFDIGFSDDYCHINITHRKLIIYSVQFKVDKATIGTVYSTSKLLITLPDGTYITIAVPLRITVKTNN